MNAAKFIADKGWEYTKTHLEKMDTENWHNDWFKDLKIYVDAWGLVEKHRGLKEAKKDIIDAKYLGMNDMIFGTSLTELKQAITLVEEVESLKEVS